MYSSEARGALKRRPPPSPHPTFAQVCPLDNTHVNHVNFQLPLHYILLKFWGGGSYGMVVRARDMRTNMKCAIKRWAAWRVPPHRGRQALAARAQAAQAPRLAHQHRAHGGYLPWVSRERRPVEHVHHRIIFFPFQFTELAVRLRDVDKAEIACPASPSRSYGAPTPVRAGAMLPSSSAPTP